MTLQLPKKPMSPLLNEQIPKGDEWGYQLKWDGVRVLAAIDHGVINLFSKKLLNKNETYPEIMQLLNDPNLSVGFNSILLDGEIIVFDQESKKPNFSKVLQREKTRSTSMQTKYPVSYVLFDLLYLNGVDWRKKPFRERYKMLQSLFPKTSSSLFVTDLFYDGEDLWNWVASNQWEGIVSKKLTSTYHDGKKHTDWYKKKITSFFDVQIVGITLKNKFLSSLVMAYNGSYFGRVSSGLNQQWKEVLLLYSKLHLANNSFFTLLPPDLKGEQITWLNKPFPCRVKGLEITSSGVLRHPQIEKIDIHQLYPQK
ncbi:ATP-dependent DNA ligase [Chengkuizengella axinellae]|uniref:DNA ligase n=1 Tax=Chengkuizengella axinellae TaxID=3064388 RepID=A0ABT9J4W1_9BACL|nr:DNA ligase [Chengkuizengella sp. 2205SS18-9]MDP5276661.1 DNA ligase [Chengkuizengella sp. 2205SS18-9]